MGNQKKASVVIPAPPQRDTIPAGLAEAEAMAVAAHEALAAMQARIDAEDAAAAQARQDHDDIGARLRAGHLAEDAEVQRVGGALHAAETRAALLRQAIPSLNAQVDAAEATVCAIADQAEKDHFVALRGYLDEMRGLQRRIEDAMAPVQATLMEAMGAASYRIHEPGQNLPSWAPASAIRQEAWRKRRHAAAEAARHAEEQRRDIERARERREQERRDQAALEQWRKDEVRQMNKALLGGY